MYGMDMSSCDSIAGVTTNRTIDSGRKKGVKVNRVTSVTINARSPSYMTRWREITGRRDSNPQVAQPLALKSLRIPKHCTSPSTSHTTAPQDPIGETIIINIACTDLKLMLTDQTM